MMKPVNRLDVLYHVRTHAFTAGVLLPSAVSPPAGQLKRARVSTTTANSGRATSEAWGDGYSASITKLEHGTSNTIQALPK
jgi:hypothetical protein